MGDELWNAVFKVDRHKVSRRTAMSGHVISEQVKAIIGDTLLAYQAIEHAMKDIARSVDVYLPILVSSPLSVSESLSMTREKVEKIVRKRAKDIAASTMGGVVKEYLKILEPLTFSEADDASTGSSFRIKFEITTGEAERKAWAKEIEELVAERNWVVHQSLCELGAATEAKRDAALEKVKACNAHAHTVLKTVGHQAERSATMRQLMAENLGGDFQMFMMTMFGVTGLMSDRKSMRPDKDGWVPVQRLLSRCEAEFGDDLKGACELTQTKSPLEFLKKQLGGIEIKEQKTKNGTRLMYKMPKDVNSQKKAVR